MEISPRQCTYRCHRRPPLSSTSFASGGPAALLALQSPSHRLCLGHHRVPEPRFAPDFNEVRTMSAIAAGDDDIDKYTNAEAAAPRFYRFTSPIPLWIGLRPRIRAFVGWKTEYRWEITL